MLEEETKLRQYAKMLHPELGEDAFHLAICDVLEKNIIIENEIAFFRVAIRRSLYKIFRHEQADREQSLAYLNGDAPACFVGLIEGRKLMNVRQSHCKRGHELIEGNLIYIGCRRACLTCKKMRDAEYYQKRKMVGV